MTGPRRLLPVLASAAVLGGAVALAVADPGDLDPTFGVEGRVVGPAEGTIAALAVDPDGNLVAAGTDFRIARYRPDGSPDESFGSGGIVETPFVDTLDRGAEAVVVHPDGRIVAAGHHGDRFALVRYLADGGVDSSFGDGASSSPPSRDGDRRMPRH